MLLLRILLTSIGAAVAGCALASFILVGEVDRWSFVPLLFAMLGSVFLLAPAYGLAAEHAVPLPYRYLRVAITGLIGGGLMLGIISVGSNPGGAVSIGAFYGAITAVCWITIHAVVKWLSTLAGKASAPADKSPQAGSR